jgi:hypothetical protein
MTTPNTDIPFVQSVYLQRRVWLDELAELTDAELQLLDTEVAGLKEEASNSVVRALEEGRDYGVMEKLVRVAGRFSYAIDREQTARQRKESFLEVTRQLSAVKAERDALRTQLDHLLAK